jgi:haloacid dehalogenase superfamily, subfamily IA, variant 1 with third motif having Dx(3-4)D or Dx(3-4)E
MQQVKFKAKGIFLDLDGTIVDSTAAYLQAAKVAFKAVNKPIPLDEVMLDLPKRLELGRPIEHITGGTTDEFLPVYLDAYHSLSEREAKLLPNVEFTLACLSKKYKIGLFTMRHVPSELLHKELDTHGIAKYFTHIVTALDTDKPKPSPEGLMLCIDALKLDICDCIMAGDSVNDLRAGKAAGVRTIGFLSGLFTREELERESPDLVLSDLSALPEYLE